MRNLVLQPLVCINHFIVDKILNGDKLLLISPIMGWRQMRRAGLDTSFAKRPCQSASCPRVLPPPILHQWVSQTHKSLRINHIHDGFSIFYLSCCHPSHYHQISKSHHRISAPRPLAGQAFFNVNAPAKNRSKPQQNWTSSTLVNPDFFPRPGGTLSGPLSIFSRDAGTLPANFSGASSLWTS